MAKTSKQQAFFTKDTMQFLMELRFNNNREWFEANRERFENHCKAPMLAFITAVAEPLRKVNRDVVADPRPNGGSMFRIYRDTRFSKDKTPYKTAMGASFRHKAGKDVPAPGFYLHVEPDGCFMGAGMWHPEPEALQRIREHVVAKPAVWTALQKTVTLEGESLTRVPKGYDKEHPLEETIRRKDFITSLPIKDKDVLSPRLVETFVEACGRANPLMKVLAAAMGL